MSRADEDASEPSAAGPPFKKRGLVRSLSTIIQGLKKQEEDRMEDEWDIMNELEAEERGETDKSAAPLQALVGDSQAAEMPLGPDKGASSSEDESEFDTGALDVNGNPRKVWKKKGLKRQTRRVIMRPVLQKTNTVPSTLPAGNEQSDEEVVEETQMPESALRRGRPGGDDDFVDDEDEGGHDANRDSQHTRGEKGKTRNTAKVADEKRAENGKEKKTKKVKPDAHANYRSLKIKNKNSRAKGRGGRFGRR